MSLTKQAKILSDKQFNLVMSYLNTKQNPTRDKVIFLLSTKSGLRSKEIANLKWEMLVDPEGKISDFIQLPNIASKGKSGRMIPINKSLNEHLIKLLNVSIQSDDFDLMRGFVITTQRSSHTSSQAVVNMFQVWYKDCGLIGCSSHSGRRTFITNCSKKINLVGGSLRDVQYLAGHTSLNTTQRYIEGDEQSKIKVVDLI